MDKKNNNPEKFAELLAAYRKGHAEQGQFLSYVDRLSAQVRKHDLRQLDRSGRGLLAADSQYRGRFLPHALRQYALLQDDYSPDDGPRSGTPCGDCFRGTGRRHYDRQRRAASMRSLRYFP